MSIHLRALKLFIIGMSGFAVFATIVVVLTPLVMYSPILGLITTATLSWLAFAYFEALTHVDKSKHV
jgi:hypothetical protein